VSPGAGLDVCEKSHPHRDLIPVPPSPQPVAIPTELPGFCVCVDVLVNCVLVFTVFDIVCTVFLYCFVYVCLFLSVLSVLV
jgi:hypothetical protein